MTSLALLWMAVGSLLTIAGFLLLNQLAQFNERTIDDVPEFLRPQQRDVDDQLFDPMRDESLRRLKVPVNFRRKQRIRLDLAAERYRCKHYHVRLLLQWGDTEWRDMHRLHTLGEYTEEALENLQIARERGRRFLRLARLVMVKIWILRIAMKLDKLLWLPTPRISALGKFLTIDVLRLYEEFREAMAEFARTYSEKESERIRTLI